MNKKSIQRLKLLSMLACIGILVGSVVGCSSSESGDNNIPPAPEVSYTISLTAVTLSASPGGAPIAVDGLPLAGKRLVITE